VHQYNFLIHREPKIDFFAVGENAEFQIAYIPHSLFWMDYLSGTLHFPLQQRNLFWVLYGLGSDKASKEAVCEKKGKTTAKQ
jgi:hypothetical protein